jgi:hypothetical protein
MNENRLLGNVVLALGLVLAGGLVGRGFVQFRTGERYVSVKGVAERTVSADIALWPLRFVAADNDLDAAQRKIQADRRTVMEFLARHGIDSTKTELQSLEVTDNRANPYGGNQAPTRFTVKTTIMVRTEDPGRIRAASQQVSELVQAGVVFSSGAEWGSSGPTYVFTRLNDLKPAMLAEATANARKAAEEFAKQSQSKVGSIRRANQGVFEIQPRDQAPGIQEGSQMQKTLRVVTTVDYFLK